MKLKIAKSIVFVETSITAEVVKRLEGLNPSALQLRDAETKEVLFVAKVGEPSVGKYGVSVNAKKDIIQAFDKPVTDVMVKEWAEPFFAKLTALEAQIAEAIEALNATVGTMTIERIAE